MPSSLSLTRRRAQKYQKKKGRFKLYVDSAVLIFQLLGLYYYFLAYQATQNLPPSLRQSYAIYNDLEDAPARPLLPFKLAGDLFENLPSPNSTDENVLECGVALSDDGFTPPVDIPRWSLPTNSTGLDAFVDNQVRPPISAIAMTP